ncbi:MAG: protease complex subunit PrcB family protein [Flavobacteriaceae bacterium]|nr:MAG: protease complex subunit PrcB family protein [Flavobacteriaceae bacterium]
MIRIVILVFFVGLMKCKTAIVNTTNTESNNVNFVTISQGVLYGNGAENINKYTIVISDQKKWDSLLNKMNSVNTVSSDFQEMPVSFSKETVIGVFDTIRNTGGIRAEINKVVQKNDTTTVIYRIKKPAPGEFVTTVITQPYHLIKIEKKEGHFVFIKEEQRPLQN